MSTICVIPARGGSKRIPRKNIRLFAGRPMIAWSIAAARDAGIFDDVIVSTDDDDIAEVARAAGASVPFRRPDALANDVATTLEVVQHAVEWLASVGSSPDVVCCLYATAPFVSPALLRRGQQVLVDSAASFAFTVVRFDAPVWRALRITGEQRLDAVWPEYRMTRTQDLESLYHDAGQFYFGRTMAWQQGTPLFSPASAPVVMKSTDVQDIDTEEDWERAEALWQTRLRQAER
jgi:pseudaminic acid cytidylyltransferase